LVCFGPAAVFAATDSGAESAPVAEGGEIPPATGDGSLTTSFASDNNFAGNSFDITAQTDLIVVGWDINLDSLGETRTIEVWTRAGTADGFEQIVAGWGLLGTATVVGVGVDVPTHVDIGGLAMTTGETRGVIITCLECVAGVGNFYYTNGGPTTFSNADMDVTTYRGMSEGFPPVSVFTYRQWNGTVHYDYDGPISVDDQSWGSLKVGYRE